MFISSIQLRKAKYLGGGFLEEMTIKPLVEFGFLFSALIKGTQSIFYKSFIKVLERSKKDLNTEAYNQLYYKRIVPLKKKAAKAEIIFFASLVAAKRNLSEPFRTNGLLKEARVLKKDFYYYINLITS